MKLQNFIAKYYDVHVQTAKDIDWEKLASNEVWIWLTPKDEEDAAEPNGKIMYLEGFDMYQWTDINGRDTKMFNEAELRKAIKAKAF